MADWWYDWVKRREKELGCNGCRNCKHQIAPLRTCEWQERGGDGIVYLICPKWERKKEQERIGND